MPPLLYNDLLCFCDAFVFMFLFTERINGFTEEKTKKKVENQQTDKKKRHEVILVPLHLGIGLEG